ncbi:hypothetical protein ABT093_36950 [Kitasatospora sp. NPDC002551]|uniref:hypothetical protein n=1 Tax=Kitasatospora sp. NPDC002551 TaxID=3154539 RepID=UPI00333127EB
MTSPARTPSAVGRSRRRLLIGALTALVLLMAAAVGGLYWLDYQDRHPKPDSGRPGAWMTTSSDEVSRFAHVGIPTAAIDIRWGYQNGFQDDLVALAFRLPQAGLEDFKATLPVSEWSAKKYVQGAYLDGFQHIGAPDPTNSFPLTHGGFQSLSTAKRISTSVYLAPWPDGTTQVWVSAVHSP